jgi:hypothetical protein
MQSAANPHYTAPTIPRICQSQLQAFLRYILVWAWAEYGRCRPACTLVDSCTALSRFLGRPMSERDADVDHWASSNGARTSPPWARLSSYPITLTYCELGRPSKSSINGPACNAAFASSSHFGMTILSTSRMKTRSACDPIVLQVQSGAQQMDAPRGRPCLAHTADSQTPRRPEPQH